jgi:hypothetical protein
MKSLIKLASLSLSLALLMTSGAHAMDPAISSDAGGRLGMMLNLVKDTQKHAVATPVRVGVQQSRSSMYAVYALLAAGVATATYVLWPTKKEEKKDDKKKDQAANDIGEEVLND